MKTPPLSPADAIAKFCRKAEWNDITGLGAGTAPCQLAEVRTVAEAVERIGCFQAAGLKIQVIGGGIIAKVL